MSEWAAGPGPSHEAPPVADPMDRTRFPVDEWRLVETRFESSDLGATESLFTVGNGYLGLRGNYEESRDWHTNGTYINGFHETWPIQHAEEAFGFAKVGQTIVNAPDAKISSGSSSTYSRMILASGTFTMVWPTFANPNASSACWIGQVSWKPLM